MIARALFLASLLSMPALAQLQIFLFDGTNETPAGALVDIGTASPGDTLVARFKVKNVSNGPAVFTTLSINGAGFTATPLQVLPYTIAPSQEAEFRVSVSPTATGTSSATLLVNTTSLIVRATSVPAATLTVAGNVTPLASGSVINFGSVIRGDSLSQTFTLANPGTTAISVGKLSVSGPGFSGPIGAAAPIPLAAGQSVSFQVTFSPLTPQPATGTLTVDQRTLGLTGLGLDPPLPAASIVLGSTSGVSAQQNSVAITLAAATQVGSTGTLTMQFRPAVAGVVDDPATQFLSGPKRSATVTITSGDSIGKFGTQSNIAFQTGSTAGTIVFTLTLPNATVQNSLVIAPAAASFASATGVRRVNDLDISLTGFDNTYSASQLAFTFFDKSGGTMQPGMIRVDVTNDFRLYFATSQVGSTFAVLATFPVTGDATQVAGVEVQLTNAAGVAKTQRIPF